MTKRAPSALANANWSELGSRAVDQGDFETARDYFTKAVKGDPSAAAPHFHLALVCDALGDYAAAAVELTTALRLKPDMGDAARRLGMIIAGRPLPQNIALDPIGLKSALQHDLVNRDRIAETAVYFLSRREPLKAVLDQGRTGGWLETARGLCVRKTHALLKDDLLLAALPDSLIRMPDLELLLTALRRVLLLEVPLERFEDKPLLTFTIALASQCWTNEFVWDAGADETTTAREKASAADAALDGSPQAAIEVLRAALYIPAPSLIPEATPLERIRSVRPAGVRDLLARLLAHHRDEQTRIAGLAELAPIKDDVSLRVAGQYGAYPYPRWNSLGYLLRPGEWRKVMAQHFDADRLSFFDAPFEVLIAGCGTGLQAIAAARAYGPNARVTAIDISKPSLGYAARMAKHFGADNLSFVAADIRDLGASAEFKSRFHVIESVGVLHHMGDPLAGWKSLVASLRSEGVMFIGLYSDIARRRWTAMHDDPAYPGVGADDAALKRFRADLMSRPDTEVGSDFKGIRDLYSTSSFRDLMLHVSEQRHSLPEIAGFMTSNGLKFAGFMGTDFEKLRDSFADEVWPGSIARWAEYEAANPDTFANMYRFWCARV